jgi:multiple sugar transport system permease protein
LIKLCKLGARNTSMRESAALGRKIWKHRGDYLFIAPGYIVFIAFMLVPLVFAIGLSFYKASFNLSAREFIGFENYRLLFQDSVFLKALVNTVQYHYSSPWASTP